MKEFCNVTIVVSTTVVALALVALLLNDALGWESATVTTVALILGGYGLGSIATAQNVKWRQRENKRKAA